MSKSYWRFLDTYGAGRTFSPGVGKAKETLTLKFLALAFPRNSGDARSTQPETLYLKPQLRSQE